MSKLMKKRYHISISAILVRSRGVARLARDPPSSGTLRTTFLLNAREQTRTSIPAFRSESGEVAEDTANLGRRPIFACRPEQSRSQ